MKKLLALLGLLFVPILGHATGNSNPLVVSSGSFKPIDVYDNASGGSRQAIVIGDATSSTTVSIDAITGMNVHLSSGAVQRVDLSTGVQVNTGRLNLGVDLSTGVTVNGTVTANISGSISNTGFNVNNTVPVTGTFFQATQPVSGTLTVLQAVTTSYIVNVTTVSQGMPGTNDWRVTMSTNVVGQGLAGTSDWRVTLATANVTQGAPGTNDWTVRMTSTTVTNTVTIQAPGGNTTPIPITGSISVASVNTTTSAPNGVMAPTLVNIAGVNASGFAQTFAVDSSSRVQIAGSISTTGGALSIVAVNASTNSVGYQANSSSLPVSVLNFPASQAVTGTFFQATQPISGNVGISQATVFGATVTYNGTQTVVSNQGTPGTNDWPVRVSTINITGITNTVTIQSPAGNTTPIPISGSLTANSVNITTAATNSAAPAANMVVGGVGINGNVSPFLMDGSSNVYVTSINNEKTDVSGTFTNATQTTSVTATGCDGYSNFLISINGTYGTATAVFEGSDDGGTTWYPIQASRDDTPVIETGYTGLTNQSRTWQINNPGLDSLRVRSTAVASGTANIRISISAAPTASGSNVSLSNVTATLDTTFPISAISIGLSGPTGLIQTPRVDASSNTYVIDQVLVSSVTTFPNPQPNGSSTTVMADAYGRITTIAGAPTSVYLSTAPSTSGAGFMVLVASPTGTLFTHVCGCMFTNTSATAVQATIYPSGGVVNPNVVLQLVAGDTRGIWSGCDKPFLNTTAGGVQVAAKISAAVSSISGYCQYIQNQTP